jgi:GNAT superfamily N-acetyltransferase
MIDLQDYSVSNVSALLDLEMIHSELVTSYWAEGRTKEEVKRSIENSMSFGLYFHKTQIGFGRVLSDAIVFAYLMDFFILEEYRGQGLGTFFMKKILENEELVDVQAWLLATRDAHSFYEKFGFSRVAESSKYMVRRNSGSSLGK